MWTPAALASEARPARGLAWRVVEHQYTVSTRKVVDTAAEQELLEEILDASKPPYPPGTEGLHYLLKTPFRYPPSPYGSRFRRPFEGRGVFYCAEALRSSLAETAYWRRRFLEASPGTPLPANQQLLTAFSVGYRTRRGLDLTREPLVRDRAAWTDPDDYGATRALADAAREAGVEVLRYESVRDPGHGANLALLEPGVFNHPNPLSSETWYLYLGPAETSCWRWDRAEAHAFPVQR